MQDFDDSTLWRISEFERVRIETGSSGYARLSGPTVLPTTLVSELARLEYSPEGNDAIEVIAACMRQREPALLYLKHMDLIWPLTLFPRERLYHSPRDLTPEIERGVRELRVHSVEPPGVRAPGHFMSDRVAEERHYRRLEPLLWALGLHGPRGTLIAEIGGNAAYRIASDTALGSLPAGGALGPAINRLQRETASLRGISRWPGMNVDRAVRLLNALYLMSGLMVFRTHSAARSEPSTTGREWLSWIKRNH